MRTSAGKSERTIGVSGLYSGLTVEVKGRVILMALLSLSYAESTKSWQTEAACEGSFSAVQCAAR
jgi:hypothetical protein